MPLSLAGRLGYVWLRQSIPREAEGSAAQRVEPNSVLVTANKEREGKRVGLVIQTSGIANEDPPIQ